MDDAENPAVDCWACNVLIGVPFTAGRKPAAIFKCGWCGALNRLEDQCQQWHSHQPQLHICRQPCDVHNASDEPGHQYRQAQQATAEQHVNLMLESQHPWRVQHQHQQHNPAGASKQSNRAELLHCCSRCCFILARWTVVAIVALLVCSISGTGILLLLPRLCTTWASYLPNLAVAVLLLINVVVNYSASAVQNPGSVQELAVLPRRGPNGEVPHGSFEGWAYCRRCRWPKPPHAHHCRSCGQCVVDMDHHCPFINNCVGAGNLRPFLLFLLWTLLAAVYVITMCSMLVWQERDVVRASIQSSHRGSSSSSNVGGLHASNATAAGSPLQEHHLNSSSSSSNEATSLTLTTAGPGAAAWMLAATGVFFVLLQMAPGWLLATYYMLAASLALLLAVGMLLWSQLSYLARGLTYIQHLKGVSGGGAAAHAWESPAALDGEEAKSVDSQQQHHRQQYDLSVVATTTAGGSMNSTNLLQQHGDAPMHKQHSAAAAAAGRHWLLWCKVREVLGAGGSTGSLLKAVLVPKWRHLVMPAAAVATGKKWT